MIEYIDQDHFYLYNGEIIPSVTQILSFIFPDKYKGIPEHILKNKATYGSKIHEAIEKFESEGIIEKLDYIQEASFNQYLRLKKEHNIEVIDQEQIIHYKDIYAGRYDELNKVNGYLSLCDIKTTAELDLEYCKYQLNLYRYAHKDKKKIKKLYIIWLAKRDIGKLVEVEIMSDNEVKDILRKCDLI